MGLLTRIERGGTLARLTGPNEQRYVQRWFNFPQLPGIRLNHHTALSIDALFACVMVISKALASCCWEVVEERANGDWDYRHNTKTYQILNVRPNIEQTPKAFKEGMFIVALLWGDSFAEIEYDVVGRPAALWPLNPERCCLERDINYRKVLRVRNFNKPDTILNYQDVYHIQGPGYGLGGFDMVVVASTVLAQAMAADRFGLKFYENGTAMGGVLTTDQPNLTETELEAISKRIHERAAGADNAFKFLLLSGGLKYQPLSQSIKDGQVVDTQYLILEKICRFYGVPPHKIQHLLRSTNNNIEHQGLEFVRDTLLPWARAAEEEATWKLLASPRMSVQIDMDELAEGDAKSTAETDSILVNCGLRRRNELRQKRGWNSLGAEGELLTVQSGMTTLENVAIAPPQGTGAPAQITQGTPPAARQQEAARTLLANALKRSMKRLHHRAIDAAANAKDEPDFERRLSSGDHAQYLTAQIGEALVTLASFDISVDAEQVRRNAADSQREDLQLILAAHKAGDVTKWCDIESRASKVAQESIGGL